MIRPRISLPLPAANGTTMVTGRVGQSCAAAGAAASMSAVMAPIDLVAGIVPPVVLTALSGKVASGFLFRKCDTAKMLERFLFPIYVKPYQSAVMLAALMIGHHFSISAFW
jgi:hypothetical protein